MKPPHLDRDWLSKKYTDEGLSTYDIAKIVKRDPKRIYEKLRDFGIPTRPRGENLKGADNFMQSGKPNPFAGHSHTAETRAVLSEKASVPKPYLRGARNGMFGRTGLSNPHFIDGSSPERQRLYASSKWHEIIRFVYQRDGSKCRRCGESKKGKRGLHTHHIKSWDSNKALRFDPSNIVTLCRKCHEWIHSKKNTTGDFLG